LKRAFDFAASLLGLIILSPLFLIIAVLIKLDSKGPVVFKQERVGKDGELFTIYKFRTMVENAENMGAGYRVKNKDPRITKIGNFLRKTSLDELPQLINIVKGEISIVGPRPTLEYQVKEYNEYQWQRLKVKPGVTGLAQINGRQSLTWKGKIDYDVQYVNNRSFLLDLKIIFKTFFILFDTSTTHKEELKKEDEEL
jgi:lipopolysaccharide/colanic/teichoic acid biosynthesis glycosyltransferase